jgi:hypothetical protein
VESLDAQLVTFDERLAGAPGHTASVLIPERGSFFNDLVR